MKKILLVVGALVLVSFGILGWMYVMNSRQATEQNEQAAVQTNRDDVVKTSNGALKSKGRYVVYTNDIIASTAGTKVLFFHAPWCPQCRALHTDIKNSTIPNGVTIIKTDYDSHQDLRQKYGVTLQTTFVLVDDKGELVDKYVAYNEPTFESVKENLLEEIE